MYLRNSTKTRGNLFLEKCNHHPCKLWHCLKWSIFNGKNFMQKLIESSHNNCCNINDHSFIIECFDLWTFECSLLSAIENVLQIHLFLSMPPLVNPIFGSYIFENAYLLSQIEHAYSNVATPLVLLHTE